MSVAPTHVVKVVSACKTYRESMKCKSLEEANLYAQAVRDNGDTATVQELDTNVQFAAWRGNHHHAQRVSKFQFSYSEVVQWCDDHDVEFSYISACANYAEHVAKWPVDADKLP